MPGLRFDDAVVINKTRFVQQDVTQAINEVAPFFLSFFRCVLVGDAAPPLGKAKTPVVSCEGEQMGKHWETPTASRRRPRFGSRRSSYEASRRFKAVTVPGFAFILIQTPFSSYDSLSTWMFLRMSASTPSLP